MLRPIIYAKYAENGQKMHFLQEGPCPTCKIWEVAIRWDKIRKWAPRFSSGDNVPMNEIIEKNKDNDSRATTLHSEGK